MSKRLPKRPRPAEPPKMTALELERVCGSLATGGNTAIAASMVNRSYRWLRTQAQWFPEIRARLEDARRLADGRVQQSMFINAVKKHNVAAQIFWMKNRANWADRTQISGSFDHHVYPGMVAKSYDAEIEAEARRQLTERPVLDVEPIKTGDAGGVRD